MTIEQLYQAFKASTGVCTDTRKIQPGNLFIALKGPNFNANEFAATALGQGCSAAIIDDEAFAIDERYLLVEDGLRALQQLASYHRQQLDSSTTFLGITGSNGKTTTKELLHAVLDTSHAVHATKGNLNNHIGVPLTLLEVTSQHKIAIIEMGANKPGDIKELCDIADPDLGLITNIGEAHIEGFGGFDGVLKTKSELFDHIRAKKGLVFVNANDAVILQAANGIKQNSYGIGKGDVNGTRTSNNQFLAFQWSEGTGHSAEVVTKLFGDHNLTNALAAVSVGLHFKTESGMIAQALSDYTPSNNRSQWQETEKNSVIMDAYNANPTSVLVALESLANMHSDRNKLVILGDMYELGDASDEAHARVVAAIQNHGIDAILVGKDFAANANGLLAFTTTDEVISYLHNKQLIERCVLVKGSRSMCLEKLYELL